jgi:hypothetical protein
MTIKVSEKLFRDFYFERDGVIPAIPFAQPCAFEEGEEVRCDC